MASWIAWRTAVISRHEQQFAVAEIKRSPQSGVRLVAIGVAAVFAIIIDGIAANVITSALPYLQGAEAASPDQASWIVTAFNAPYFATMLFCPWLYARFGRKPLLLAGLVGFSLASLALAGTQTLACEVALRFLQGLCLGTVYVTAAVLLLTSLPLPVLPFVPIVFSTMALGAGLMGNLIGGSVAENYGGNATYLPGALATLIAAALIFAAPNVDSPQRQLRPDIIGYTLSIIMFGAMQYLANEGERRNWFGDESIVAAVMVLAVVAPAFVIWELRAIRPHLNLRLLAQKRNLAVGVALNVVLGLVGYAVVPFVLYMETQIEATETLAGEMIFLRLFTYVVGIVLAFSLVKLRILTVRALMCIAAVSSAVLFVAFGETMTTTAEAASFVAISLIFGLFFSMLSQPVPALVLGSLGLGDLPAGLAMYKLSAPVGLMIGTATFQTLLDHRNTMHMTNLAASITLARSPVADYLRHGGSLSALSGIVRAQAQSLAFEDVMIGIAAFVLLTIPLVFFADTRAGSRR